MSAEELSYREAVCEALREEMRRDERVVFMGEDVAAAGGPFKTSVGLLDEFGKDRVRDTPISETAILGAALGMAITGLRPVAEIMFADFLHVCMDQLVNSIAKYRYMCGGQTSVPLVVRTAAGGGLSFGAQHSQSGEPWLMQFPGLKIASAATPDDAYSLIKAAIRDDNPVVIYEHKALYGKKGPVYRTDDPPPLRGAKLSRSGGDVTLVASLGMVYRALEAAERLAEDGIDVEVIDLRVLKPLDSTLIVESVRKTNRIVTVEESHRDCGIGAEVVSRVATDAFEYLDEPPVRITLPDAPLPFSPPLEEAAIPSVDAIVEGVRRVVR